MKCMVMFQYSICDIHFSIMKAELISVRFFFLILAIHYSSLRLSLMSGCSPVKKKDLVRFESEHEVIKYFFFIHLCSMQFLSN